MNLHPSRSLILALSHEPVPRPPSQTRDRLLEKFREQLEYSDEDINKEVVASRARDLLSFGNDHAFSLRVVRPDFDYGDEDPFVAEVMLYAESTKAGLLPSTYGPRNDQFLRRAIENYVRRTDLDDPLERLPARFLKELRDSDAFHTHTRVLDPGRLRELRDEAVDAPSGQRPFFPPMPGEVSTTVHYTYAHYASRYGKQYFCDDAVPEIVSDANGDLVEATRIEFELPVLAPYQSAKRAGNPGLWDKMLPSFWQYAAVDWKAIATYQGNDGWLGAFTEFVSLPWQTASFGPVKLVVFYTESTSRARLDYWLADLSMLDVNQGWFIVDGSGPAVWVEMVKKLRFSDNNSLLNLVCNFWPLKEVEDFLKN